MLTVHDSSRARRRAAAVLMMIALIGVAGCGSSSAGSSSSSRAASGPKAFTLKIGMTTTNGVVSGNMAWGKKEGTLLAALKSQGVTGVSFATFQAGPDVQSALNSGAIQVAINGDLPALQAKGAATPADTRQIGFDYINGDTYLIGAKGGPTTLQGLQGKEVGAPTNTVRYRFAYSLLAEKGLLKQVKLSNLTSPEAIAALKSGQIGAASLTGVQAAQLVQQGYPVIARADQYPSLLSTEETTALTSFLNAHPGFVAAWDRAIVDTDKSIHAHAAAFWNYTAGLDQVSPGIERAGDPLNQYNTQPFPAAGISQLESTYQFCRSQKLIQRPFNVRAWLLRS